MKRVFQLARLAGDSASPNPQVGALIVFQDRIIGEGFHKKSGEAHAEINALNSVSPDHIANISKSTIYVSLEPCSYFGKTPACATALVKAKIKRVVIGQLDPNPRVNGKGMEILRSAGIQVDVLAMKPPYELPHASFSTSILQNRPRIILKYAQSQDKFIGKKGEAVWLTNDWSKRLVHKWRAESGAILVGTNTAQTDNPLLTTRYGFGKSPLRIVVDLKNKLDANLKLFTSSAKTLVLVEKIPGKKHQDQVEYLQVSGKNEWKEELNAHLLEKGINRLLVEGGSQTLQSYIDAKMWDEIMVFTSDKVLQEGISAPTLPVAVDQRDYDVLGDKLTIFTTKQDKG